MSIANTQSRWWGNLCCFLTTVAKQVSRTTTTEYHRITWSVTHLRFYNPLEASAEKSARLSFARVIVLSQTTEAVLNLTPNGASERKIVKHVIFCRMTKKFSEMYPDVAQQPNLSIAIQTVTEHVEGMIDSENYLKMGILRNHDMNELNNRMSKVHEYSVKPTTLTSVTATAELRAKIENAFCDFGKFIVSHSSEGFEEKTRKLKLHYTRAFNDSKALINP